MTMWLPASALAGLPGMPGSRYGVQKLANASEWDVRQRSVRGGRQSEYPSSALPEATQQALASQAAGAMRPLLTAMEAGDRSQRASQVQRHTDAMARVGVKLENAGAFDPARNPRLDLFQRFEAYHHARGCAVWPAIKEFCQLWDAGQIDALAATRESYPTIPAKTLDRLYRAWRTEGVEALVERKPRNDKGRTALTQDEGLYQAFVGAVAEIHNPTWRQVHRLIVQQVGEERAPSRTTLNRWLADFKANNKVALLKLKNPDGWRNKYMPAFGSRSEHITVPNEEWQLDSTIADAQQRIEVAFSLTDGATGEIRRHALVAGIDVFTRRACVLVSRTSSSNSVKALVRRCMLSWGKPERIKTDNGKDYTSKDFDFGLDALRIDHLLCTPFSPDQKPFIERFLGTLLHDLFPMLQGFVGHDVATRKAIESGLSFAKRFGHEEGVRLRMTPEQLQGVIDGWLDEYHGRVHGELGCSPNDMAERHLTRIVRVDERALDLFLMPVAGNGIRTVGKRGISMPLNDRAGTAWYRAPELASVHVMGQQVYCRIDDADIGAMHVFAMDGTYICRALDHSRLGINKSELAAKARVIESETVKPMLDQLRKAKKKGLTQQAVNAIYADKQEAAINVASNVTRLGPRVLMDTTPAIESVIHRPDAHAAAREAAREALAADATPAPTPVIRLESPKQRYSAWVRLHARKDAGEQIGQRELDWAADYESSNEFQAWDAMQGGEDPLAEATG